MVSCEPFRRLHRTIFSYVASYFLCCVTEDFSCCDGLAKSIMQFIKGSKCEQEIVAYACGLIVKIKAQTDTPLTCRNIRRFFFVSLIISFCMLSDEPLKFTDWNQVSHDPFSNADLERIQQLFLRLIDWSASLSPQDFRIVTDAFAEILPIVEENFAQVS